MQKTGQMRIEKWIWIFGLLFCLSACTKQPAEPSTTEYDPYAYAEEQTVVIQKIDLEEGTMSFIDIDDGKGYDLLYNSGVDVRNKYDEIMSGSMLEAGQIVDIVYNTENQKLLEISINPDAWEVRQISGFEFERAENQAEILNQKYKYTSNLVIVSNGEIIGMNEVCKEDQITARGYGGKLCSITVDLGHGYVKLEDYDTYIGGMIEIGYDVIVPVTEEMLLTVREGEYKLKITKGEHSGYKNVVVLRDEECTVSLKELQIAPDPIGSLFFDVTPRNARIMIDGETIDTSETVELTYGRHQIRVTAEGYETKEGYITVNAAYKIFTIELEGGEESDSAGSTTANGTASPSNNSSGTTEKNEDSPDQEDSDGSATNETQKTGNTVTIEKPVGAYCYVDGDLKGTVPCTFEKTVGSHVITFSMTGCLVKSYTITCQDNGKDDTYSFDALPTYESVLFEEE